MTQVRHPDDFSTDDGSLFTWDELPYEWMMRDPMPWVGKTYGDEWEEDVWMEVTL